MFLVCCINDYKRCKKLYFITPESWLSAGLDTTSPIFTNRTFFSSVIQNNENNNCERHHLNDLFGSFQSYSKMPN